MSELKTIEQLTFESGGISALADRPNQPSTFGMGGLSASELKKKFDELATEVKDKINEVIAKVLQSNEATKYIPFPTERSFVGGYQSVYDFIDAFKDGKIAQDLQVKTNNGVFYLSEIINTLLFNDSKNAEDIEGLRLATEAVVSALRQEHQYFATKGEIPTKTSQLENDGDGKQNFATFADAYEQARIFVESNGYAKKSDISKIFKPCGSVQTYYDLPLTPDEGDTYNVIQESVVDGKTYPAGTNFAWSYNHDTGTYFWDALGGNIDFSSYLKAEDAEAIYAKKGETGSNEVTRIDVGVIYQKYGNTSEFSDAISEAIENAVNNRPTGANRTNIEFYNSISWYVDASWNGITWKSNCNYSFATIYRSEVAYPFIANIENCTFTNFNLKDGYQGLVFMGCKNLQFINCTFGAGTIYFQQNCANIYLENCSFGEGGLYIDDNATDFRWIMVENCIFRKKTYGYTIGGTISNPKHLLIFSNCFFDNLSKVSIYDISISSGVISIIPDQTVYVKSAYEYAQEGGYTGTESEFTQDFARAISLTSAEVESV